MFDIKRWNRLKVDFINREPFFGSVFLNLKVIDTDEVAVAATNGADLFINSSSLMKMSDSEISFVLLHETLHVAHLHMYRRQDRDPQRWNQACDYAINNYIHNLNKPFYMMPEGGLLSAWYDGLSAEQIYKRLEEEEESNDKKHGGALADDLLEPTEPEMQVRSSVEAARHIARMQGNLSADFDRQIDDWLTPVTPWPSLLRKYFQTQQPSGQSWNRPNRRYLWRDLHLPSKRKIPDGDIVIAVDTSGSISLDELKRFASEIRGLQMSCRPRQLRLLFCDCEVDKDVTINKPLKLDDFSVSGGGGTSFVPVFDAVDQADVLVYLTDGYGDFPKEAPPYPVIWVINNDRITAPFGVTTRLDP